ncbi:ubiquinone/menaquinone biosynthesis C-methylase UbiE [Antricoccus suffuscus]|uniref:Ubiquinone/menaquinone biosynthesis C-methylase UbiE n=1 Tax=Antricoccus suffuscus TaxID=1629062 RepID=A0A2T0YYT3_9ACTN|nr:methyltransferase domain-containing protein [Antricoccus suffuscus]PRZ29262.1 ubiquinone/menaquinone biosynthesis C-methylase UbiE [Antricoccus suffuscus]
MSAESDRYTHGHHESVLRSHTWRTADNSAAYLLPHLRPAMRLLDVGCGPATITIDFARILSSGSVVGLEPIEQPLETARKNAADAGVGNIEFVIGDVYGLEYADDSFDVVHAHQVLQHLTDPVAAIKEMARVCKPDGYLAFRDADYAAMSWFPQVARLDEWQELYQTVTRSNRAEPNAGRHLKKWSQDAGLVDMTLTASVWSYATAEEVAWWSSLWADRTISSNFGVQAVADGHVTAEEAADISAGWREWGEDPAAVFFIPNAEVLARPSKA